MRLFEGFLREYEKEGPRLARRRLRRAARPARRRPGGRASPRPPAPVRRARARRGGDAARLERGGGCRRGSAGARTGRSPPRPRARAWSARPQSAWLIARAAVASTDWATRPARSQVSSAVASAWSALAYSPRSRSAVASQWSAWKPTSERPTCSASSAARRSERSAPSRSPLRQRTAPRSRCGEAELAGEALALDQGGDRLGPRLDGVPFTAVEGERRERGVQLDLRRQVADPLGDLERLAVGLGGRRRSRPRRSRSGSPARAAPGSPRPGPTRAPARPSARGSRGRARSRRSARTRGRRSRARGSRPRASSRRSARRSAFSGGVDREHVVAGVHVERGGLLVQAHELEAGRPVLQQVDPALVVADRALAVALVPEPGADLAVQVADPRQVLLAAVVLEALLPELDGAVDAARAAGRRRRASRRSGRGSSGCWHSPPSPSRASAAS